MPQIKPKRTRPLGWLFWVGLIAAFACLLWQYPLIVSGLLLALTATGIFESRRSQRHFHELAASRTDESICTFARSFNRHSVDTWVIRAVYEELQRHLGPVPVRAQDVLVRDLRIDGDDLDFDLVPDIAERTGRSLQKLTGNPYYGKVETVGDLVFCFNSQPKIS